ncbi:MAG: hypothetical protein H7834_09340 [Magnetococcus sp. YQC-9]
MSWIQYERPAPFLDTIRSDRAFMALLFVVTCIVFVITSSAWPISEGRDFGRYLTNAVIDRMGDDGRLTNWLIGFFLQHDLIVLKIFLMLGYMLSVFALYYLARLFGKPIARMTALAAILNVQIPVYLHFLCSDPFNFIGFNLWVLIVVRAIFWQKAISGAMVIGIASFLLVTIRPVNQLFILTAALPIICHGFTRRSITTAMTILAVFVAGVMLYSLHNYIKFNVFSLTSSTGIPSYTIYHKTKTMSPANGPASARLFFLVENHLLDKPEYKNFSVTVESFFASGNKRFHGDLVGVADEFEPGLLEKAYLESITTHPKAILKTIIGLMEWGLRQPFDPSLPLQCQPIALPDRSNSLSFEPPQPGQYYSNKANQEDATPAELIHQVNQFSEQTRIRMAAQQPVCFLTDLFKSALFPMFPPMLWFWLLSIPLLFMYYRMEFRLLLGLLLPSGLVIGISLITQSPWAQYRMPYDFPYILSGMLGMAILLDKIMKVYHDRSFFR